MPRSEVVTAVELLGSGELLLSIDGSGDPSYQMVYREAAGVYWDPDRRGFKSTPLRDWSCADWFSHIVAVVEQGLGVKLRLHPRARWTRVPDQDVSSIRATAVLAEAAPRRALSWLAVATTIGVAVGAAWYLIAP
jgi:hypothetical protein